MTSKPKSEQNWPNARTGFSLQGTWQGGILVLGIQGDEFVTTVRKGPMGDVQTDDK